MVNKKCQPKNIRNGYNSADIRMDNVLNVMNCNFYKPHFLFAIYFASNIGLLGTTSYLFSNEFN